jgi:hypothetical protein
MQNDFACSEMFSRHCDIFDCAVNIVRFASTPICIAAVTLVVSQSGARAR